MRFVGHHVASNHVFVVVAQASGLPLNDELAGVGGINFDVDNVPVLSHTPQYRCSRLHADPFNWWRSNGAVAQLSTQRSEPEKSG